MHQKISAHVDGGAERKVSLVCRPGSEDPNRRESGNFLVVLLLTAAIQNLRLRQTKKTPMLICSSKLKIIGSLRSMEHQH